MFKTRKSKVLALILAICMVIVFAAGCGGGGGGGGSKASGSKEGGFTFGAAMISLNAPIWIELMDAGDECAKEYDSTVIWKSAEGNLENQIALIEGFIEQKVD